MHVANSFFFSYLIRLKVFILFLDGLWGVWAYVEQQRERPADGDLLVSDDQDTAQVKREALHA